MSKGTVTMTSGISAQENLPLDKGIMLSVVHNTGSRAYFKEAVDCFNAGAYRASVVMMACAVFDDVRIKAADFAPMDGTAKLLSEQLEATYKKQDSYERKLLDLTKKWDRIPWERVSQPLPRIPLQQWTT